MATAVNNLEIEAVLYLTNSFAVLFSEPSLFNLAFQMDLQNNVWLSLITAKPPANKGESLLFIMDSILFIISSLSIFKSFPDEKTKRIRNNKKFIYFAIYIKYT
jgi:hypothetical protein